MWVNFKPNRQDSTTSSLRSPTLQLPRSMSRPDGIKRQSSTQSSIRSNKSSTSMSHLQKKVEEHFFKTQTSEWQKQEVYRCRRNRKKIQERQERAFTRLRTTRRMYIPAILFMLLGTVILFGSTIRSLGEGTLFWTNKQIFSIIGPIVLVLGIIMLLVVVGFENKFSKEKVEVEFEPFIHPDFKVSNGYSRQGSHDTSSISLERGRSIYSLNDSQNRSVFVSNNHCKNEMAQRVRNMSTEGQQMDIVARWANAMENNLSVDDSAAAEIQDSDNHTETNRYPFEAEGKQRDLRDSHIVGTECTLTDSRCSTCSVGTENKQRDLRDTCTCIVESTLNGLCASHTFPACTENKKSGQPYSPTYLVRTESKQCNMHSSSAYPIGIESKQSDKPYLPSNSVGTESKQSDQPYSIYYPVGTESKQSDQSHSPSYPVGTESKQSDQSHSPSYSVGTESKPKWSALFTIESSGNGKQTK